MSYVLDALRRADAERDRGAVPDLHAHASPAPSDEASVGAGRQWLVAVLGAAAAVLLFALAWLLWARGDAAPNAPAAQPLARAAPGPASATTLSPIAPAPTPPQVLIRIEAPAAVPAPTPVRSETAKAPSAPTAKLQDLPDALRRQLPTMAFGGAMDSPVASSRMLIINGQVFREGESPANGLTLERIQLRSATFNFKGQRFEASY